MKKILILSFVILYFNLYSNTKKEQLELLFKVYHDSAAQIINGEKSLAYSFELLEIGNQLKNDSLIALAQIELAYDYSMLGNYVSALNYVYKAAEYYKNVNRTSALSTTYNIIGTFYLNQNNYSLSLDFLKKALQLHISNNNPPIYIGDDYLNIGEVFRLSEQFDSAFYYFSKAQETYEEIADEPIRIAYAQCNLGLIHSIYNNNYIADSLFNLSFGYLKSIGDHYPICITYYEIAKKAFLQDSLPKATKYANLAYELAYGNAYNKEKIKILYLLSDIYNKSKDYHKSLNYIKEYQIIKDSLLNDKNISKIAEMRAEFEISQNESEMNYLKKISKTRANMLIMAAVSLFLIVLLSVFLYRQSKKRKYANLQLAEYNEELTQKNEIIHNQLDEKDILMREIHHRVKNNLQIISSIINLQSMRIENEETIEIFNEMQRRIMAISSIHQKLYQSDSVTSINMKDYLGDIVESIHSAFNNENLHVNYEIAIQNVSLDIDAAVSIGLIVNELTTNAYKYAFHADKENLLYINLTLNDNANCHLIVHDNGPGIPEGKDIFKTNSLGIRMVWLLTRQMKGEVNVVNDQGAKFELTFADIKNS